MRTLTVAILGAWTLVTVAAAPATAEGLVGKAAPEITAIYWLNSPALTLQGLRGKIVVVEFWATWCGPCRRSIPHLVELYKKYNPQGVVFIGLTDEPRAKVEPFAKELGMIYAVGGGSTSLSAYGVTGIPTAFIVDTSGNVVWEGHPMAPAFATALEEQMKKTPPTLLTPEEQAAAVAALEAGAPKMSPVAVLMALEEVAEKFPATKAGQAAADKAKAMRTDSALMGKIQADAADKECKGWLSMARSFIKAGMPEKAKPYLDQVLQKYPDTAYAKEAKELLGPTKD